MKAAVLIAVSCYVFAVATVSASWQSPPAPPSQTTQAAAQAQGAPAPLDPKAIERGRTVFVENCTACHGQTATGGSDANTDLTRSLVIKNDVDGKQFAQFLADGRPELRMPGFALEPDSVKDLAAYLHSISVLKSKPDAEPPRP